MMKEVIDPKSGAILFKEDEETILLKELAEKITKLEARIKELEKDYK